MYTENFITTCITAPLTSVNKRKSVSFQVPPLIPALPTAGNLPTGALPAQPPAQPVPDAQPVQRVPIPFGADEVWKLTRKHLSAAVKSNARADHLDYLARNQLVPNWTLGVESLPGYLRPHIAELSSHRHIQALETMNEMSQRLRSAASVSRNLGIAQRTVLRQLYGESQNDFAISIAKINELVIRDESECRTSLSRRVEALQANPLQIRNVQDYLLQQPNYLPITQVNRRVAATAPRPADNPQPSTNGYGRGNNPQPSTSGYGRGNRPFEQRSSRPRGRGRGSPRGGRGRGNSAGRGRRARSRSLPRNQNRSGGNAQRLPPDEERVLQAYRNSKNSQ